MNVKTKRPGSVLWMYVGSRSVTIAGDPRLGLPVPRLTAVIVQGADSNRAAIVGSDDGDRRLKPSSAPKKRRECHCLVCGEPGHNRRSKLCRLAPES